MKTLISGKTNNEIDIETMRPRVAELERDELEQILSCQRLLAKMNIARNIVKQSKDAIYISTKDNRFVDVNQSLLDLLGYEAEDLIGEPIGNVCINPNEIIELQKEVELRGYVIDHRIKLLKKDGSVLPCLVTATVRWYNDENIPGNQPLFKFWIRKSI